MNNQNHLLDTAITLLGMYFKGITDSHNTCGGIDTMLSEGRNQDPEWSACQVLVVREEQNTVLLRSQPYIIITAKANTRYQEHS